MNSLHSKIWLEVYLRLSLIFIYIIIGLFEPLERKIQPEELWCYRYPPTKSYCSFPCLWSTVCIISAIIIVTNYYIKNDEKDLLASVLAITLCITLAAAITRLLKFVTGKPRPDFYWRCFPQGYGNKEMRCTGDKGRIKEGRQSFPSGHASLAFAGFGFISLYLMGKLHVYKFRGTGETWRWLACLLPIILACIVGISRICDYHHHAIDVFAGTLLGCFIAIVCYHHYYPPFYNPSCDVPYTETTKVTEYPK